MLNYPTPQGFVQALRQRRRALPDTVSIIVVEGATDKRALSPFLADNVVLVPARGCTEVVRAFRELDGPLRRGVAFLLDCDGSVDSSLKGHVELVITKNRDVEADLVFELDAMQRVAHELLSSPTSTRHTINSSCQQTIDDAVHICTSYGSIHKAAVSAQHPVRIYDSALGQRRKLRIADLPNYANWLGPGARVSVEEIVSDAEPLLGWTRADGESVVTDAMAILEASCRRHSQVACLACRRMSLCNGHILVEVLRLMLGHRHSASIHHDDELARLIRTSSDPQRVEEWDVVKRFRRWEASESRELVRRFS